MVQIRILQKVPVFGNAAAGFLALAEGLLYREEMFYNGFIWGGLSSRQAKPHLLISKGASTLNTSNVKL